jgi:hypothetical protein
MLAGNINLVEDPSTRSTSRASRWPRHLLVLRPTEAPSTIPDRRVREEDDYDEISHRLNAGAYLVDPEWFR